MEKTNIFISYSFNKSYDEKEKLARYLEDSNFGVNYSEKEDISGHSDQYIWKYLKNRISGSSVMVVLYSRDFEEGNGGKALKIRDSKKYSYELTSFDRQGWIYKEIRCALRSQENNSINGVIVVMPDEIHEEKYNQGRCSKSGNTLTNLNANNYPPILKHNYGNKLRRYWKPDCGCCFNILEDSFIPIIKMSSFKKNPKYYIDLVKAKRDEVNKYDIKKETG